MELAIDQGDTDALAGHYKEKHFDAVQDAACTPSKSGCLLASLSTCSKMSFKNARAINGASLSFEIDDEAPLRSMRASQTIRMLIANGDWKFPLALASGQNGLPQTKAQPQNEKASTVSAVIEAELRYSGQSKVEKQPPDSRLRSTQQFEGAEYRSLRKACKASSKQHAQEGQSFHRQPLWQIR